MGDELLVPLDPGKDVGVGREADEGPVGSFRVLALAVPDQPPLLELGPAKLAVAVAADLEVGR